MELVYIFYNLEFLGINPQKSMEVCRAGVQAVTLLVYQILLGLVVNVNSIMSEIGVVELSKLDISFRIKWCEIY